MIYVFIANGFEEIEALSVVDLLRRIELPVKMVGVGSKTVTGAHGITVQCDIADDMAVTKDLEMIVLPGGMPGTLNLEKSETVQSFITHALNNDLWIGAICAAPSILGHRGDLTGKRFTCFPGFEDAAVNGLHQNERLVQDGKIITAKGPGVALDFALKLAECLAGKERTNKLKAALQ